MCAGNALPTPRGTPRNGGSRGRAAWRREALPNRRLRPPPSGSQGELPQRGKRGWPGPLVTFWPSRKSLAPQGETLQNGAPHKRKSETCPPHPPPSGAPSPIPSGLRPSPLDKGSRPPGGRLRKGRRRNFSSPIHSPITHSNIEIKTTPERRYAP